MTTAVANTTLRAGAAEQPVTDHFRGAGAEDAGRAGPLAAEILRLMSSMQGWVQGWAEHTPGEAKDSHSCSDCRWCPLCQFVAVLRGERPEVTERVAEVGTAVASALTVLVEAAGGAGGAAAQSRQPHPSPRVQKINLGDHG